MPSDAADEKATQLSFRLPVVAIINGTTHRHEPLQRVRANTLTVEVSDLPPECAKHDQAPMRDECAYPIHVCLSNDRLSSTPSKLPEPCTPSITTPPVF